MAGDKLGADLETHPSTSNKSRDPSIKENAGHQTEPTVYPVASDELKEKEIVTPAVATEKEIVNTNHEVVDDDGTHYVHGAARIALVFGLCVATFLVGLDNLIIATAIPKLTTLFHSLPDVGWYGYVFVFRSQKIFVQCNMISLRGLLGLSPVAEKLIVF